MRVVITGNANSGKTTLFNALTGKSLRVGNWHGVTVDLERGQYNYLGQTIEVYDLPGIASFNGYTMEEKLAIDFLKGKDYDLIINVIEAVRFMEAINLTKELRLLNKPMICVVNMTKDLLLRGGQIDFDKLKSSGLKFFNYDLTKKSDIKKLEQNIAELNAQSAKFDLPKDVYFPPKNLFTKQDNFFTDKFKCIGFTIFVIVISFYLAFGRFGIGKLIGNLLCDFINLIKGLILNLVVNSGGSQFTYRLIDQGVFAGITTLLGFLPSICVLNLVLLYLEHSGIISRISFVCDGFLSKIGLNGRIVFAMIMGFGCTTIGINLTKGFENQKEKNLVVKSLCFISCSAKFPVYLYFTIGYNWLEGLLILTFLYLIGIILAVIILKINGKDKSLAPPLILELPILRLNCLKNLFKPLINSLKQFIIKISTTVLVVSLVVFFLGAFSTSFEYLPQENIDKSILAFIGGKLTYLFYPINVFDYKVGTAIFSGIFAKESVLSVLATLNAELNYSFATKMALAVFIALYPPCLTAIFSMKKAIGGRKTIYFVTLQTMLALLFSYVTHLVLVKPIILLIIIGGLLIFFVIKRIKHERFCSRQKHKTI